MTLQELNLELDNIDISFYESGAYYDSSRESWEEKLIAELEKEYQLTVIEP